MFFVHHHHGQRTHGRKHGRACAQRNANLTRAQTPPSRPTVRRRKSTVQNRYVVTKTSAKACRELRGQRDLWYHNQRPFALRPCLSDEAQVDFGLARTCDAVEQEAAVSLAQRRCQCVERGCLVRVENGRLDCRPRRRSCRPSLAPALARTGHPVDDLDQASLEKMRHALLGPGASPRQSRRAQAARRAQSGQQGPVFRIECEPCHVRTPFRLQVDLAPSCLGEMDPT